MLEVHKVTKTFRGLVALKDVDLLVEEGEICGLIGPNGAGKTTMFNCVSGIHHPTSGKIKFNGLDITRFSPHQICKLGIGRVFQIPRPFMGASLLKNAMIGALFGKNKSTSMEEAHQKALSSLEFVGLFDKKDLLARDVGIYDRKMLGLASALAVDPRLLLVDENMAGLDPTEVSQSMEKLRRIRDELHITVFWVEHVMKAVMNVADRVIVLNHGEKIAEGRPKDLVNDKKVIEIYLGKRYAI